jgi:hypothetical protein
MKFIRLIPIGIFLLLFTSCENEKSSLANNFNNDFETMGYWAESPRITREKSHSGNFSTFSDTTNIYTQTLSVRVKDIKNNNIKSILGSVWVLSNSPAAKGKLVVSIEKNGSNLIWEGVEVQNTMRVANQWTEVLLKVDVKTQLSDDCILKMYGLNDGKQKIYWDDFSLNFE